MSRRCNRKTKRKKIEDKPIRKILDNNKKIQTRIHILFIQELIKHKPKIFRDVVRYLQKLI